MQCVGIAFKFAKTVSSNDFLGLKDMRSERPHLLGIVFYMGEEPIAFSEKLVALPIRVIL